MTLVEGTHVSLLGWRRVGVMVMVVVVMRCWDRPCTQLLFDLN